MEIVVLEWEDVWWWRACERGSWCQDHGRKSWRCAAGLSWYSTHWFLNLRLGNQYSDDTTFQVSTGHLSMVKIGTWALQVKMIAETQYPIYQMQEHNPKISLTRFSFRSNLAIPKSHFLSLGNNLPACWLVFNSACGDTFVCCSEPLPSVLSFHPS